MFITYVSEKISKELVEDIVHNCLTHAIPYDPEELPAFELLIEQAENFGHKMKVVLLKYCSATRPVTPCSEKSGNLGVYENSCDKTSHAALTNTIPPSSMLSQPFILILTVDCYPKL